MKLTASGWHHLALALHVITLTVCTVMWLVTCDDVYLLAAAFMVWATPYYAWSIRRGL